MGQLISAQLISGHANNMMNETPSGSQRTNLDKSRVDTALEVADTTGLFEKRLELLALVVLQLSVLNGEGTKSVVELDGFEGSTAGLILRRLGTKPEENVEGAIGVHRLEDKVRVT